MKHQEVWVFWAFWKEMWWIIQLLHHFFILCHFELSRGISQSRRSRGGIDLQYRWQQQIHFYLWCKYAELSSSSLHPPHDLHILHVLVCPTKDEHLLQHLWKEAFLFPKGEKKVIPCTFPGHPWRTHDGKRWIAALDHSQPHANSLIHLTCGRPLVRSVKQIFWHEGFHLPSFYSRWPPSSPCRCSQTERMERAGEHSGVRKTSAR